VDAAQRARAATACRQRAHAATITAHFHLDDMTSNAYPRHAIAPRDASPAARRNTGIAPVVVGHGLLKQSGATH